MIQQKYEQARSTLYMQDESDIGSLLFHFCVHLYVEGLKCQLHVKLLVLYQ